MDRFILKIEKVKTKLTFKQVMIKILAWFLFVSITSFYLIFLIINAFYRGDAFSQATLGIQGGLVLVAILIWCWEKIIN